MEMNIILADWLTASSPDSGSYEWVVWLLVLVIGGVWEYLKKRLKGKEFDEVPPVILEPDFPQQRTSTPQNEQNPVGSPTIEVPPPLIRNEPPPPMPWQPPVLAGTAMPSVEEIAQSQLGGAGADVEQAAQHQIAQRLVGQSVQTRVQRKTSVQADEMRRALDDPHALRMAILYREIIDRPTALRNDRF